MFRMKLTINQKMLDDLRALPERAQRNLRRRMQTELKPELQQDTDALLGPPPGPQAEHFQFASRRSRRYYMALIVSNPDLAAGGHWKRTGDLGSHFRVAISDRLRMDQLTISNIKRESTGTKPFPANYVYGPWAPAGHILAGYPEQAQIAAQLLREKAIASILALWRESLLQAMKGQD